MIGGSWLQKQRTNSRILDQLGGQSPYYHDLVRRDRFQADGGETTIKACLQLGGGKAPLEGQAEACGCSLDGDDPSLGGWDGLRGRAVGDHSDSEIWCVVMVAIVPIGIEPPIEAGPFLYTTASDLGIRWYRYHTTLAPRASDSAGTGSQRKRDPCRSEQDQDHPDGSRLHLPGLGQRDGVGREGKAAPNATG
jgi:hypothetical protein